ncbi:MAG: ABC transporter ATP-binding protein [Actinocatenispora sp.]
MASDAVTLHGIRKHYGDVVAVAGIDLTIPTGQVVALLGTNGAGKTTTVDIMLGLRRADAGTVRLFGQSPRRSLDAGDVGAVLQSGELISGATVEELLRAIAALHPHPLPVAQVAERAGLGDLLRRRTDRLSGGQAQRVRFAIALIGDPRLLVLDEPTAGLDVAARREFWLSVREYAGEGRTVLFSTHYLEEADEMADRIVLINQGRVVADGPTTAIKAMTAARLVRCTLPGADRDELAALPGVSTVEVRGDSVLLRCADSDATLRALLSRYADARDIDVTSAPLADAFLALTATDATTDDTQAGPAVMTGAH